MLTMIFRTYSTNNNTTYITEHLSAIIKGGGGGTLQLNLQLLGHLFALFSSSSYVQITNSVTSMQIQVTNLQKDNLELNISISNNVFKYKWKH